MSHSETISACLRLDAERYRILDLVRSLGLPDCWIGAGFVRDAIWDLLHGREPARGAGDVDILWFYQDRTDRSEDDALEAHLRSLDPSIDWSVKNQARMHARNGDAPYMSSIDAMRFWPETATAVAARLDACDRIEIAAPLGLEDLFGLILRPGPGFTRTKHAIFLDRINRKRWLERWPLLKVDGGHAAGSEAAL